MTQKIVQVQIFDQTYRLGGDPDYILQLAECVDSKMRTIADEDATVDSACLGVLAALNIALEGEESRQPSTKLFTEEDKQRVRERRRQHRTRRWYERQLVAVAEARLVMSDKEYKALLTLAGAEAAIGVRRPRDS